jgi:hypothetical protein
MTSDTSTHLKRTCALAIPDDLPYVLHLQQKWSNNIGFLPKIALERALNKKEILVVRENGDPAGYLYWTARADGLIRVIQCAVDPQLLRTTIGTKIMRHLERAGLRAECSILRLTTRCDLPANEFWPELGMNMTGVLTPHTRKGHAHYEWSKSLLSPTKLATAIATGRRPFKRDRGPTLHDFEKLTIEALVKSES